MPGEIYFCPHFLDSPSHCFCVRLFKMIIPDICFTSAMFSPNVSSADCPPPFPRGTWRVLLGFFFYLESSLSSPWPSDDDDGEKLVNGFGVDKKKMGGRVPPKLNHGRLSKTPGAVSPDRPLPKIDGRWGAILTETLRGMNSTCSLASQRRLINNAGSNGAERGLNLVPGRAGRSKVTLRKRKLRESLTQVVGGSVGGSQG